MQNFDWIRYIIGLGGLFLISYATQDLTKKGSLAYAIFVTVPLVIASFKANKHPEFGFMAFIVISGFWINVARKYIKKS